MNSVKMLKRVIEEFSLAKNNFRCKGWTSTEFGNRDEFSGRLIGDFIGDKTKEDILNILFKINKIPIHMDFILIDWKEVTKHCVQMKFTVKPRLAGKIIQRLNDTNLELRFGFGAIQLEHKKFRKNKLVN